MKKMIIGFFAVLLAAAALGNYEPATTTNDDELYWFVGTTFVGTGTIAEKELICNGDQPEICMEGFLSAPGNQRPTVAPYHTLKRED